MKDRKKKIEKMVKAYNKYATKHGYPTIEIDFDNKKIIGEYVPRSTEGYSGFFGYLKAVNTAGHNESMRCDYQRIVEELSKL